MAASALIHRELRILSRQGQMFWIRVISGAVAIITLFLFFLREVLVGRELGSQLFAALNHSLLLTILAVGPLITADSIAQEKREGTLGLLFLAPLKPQDIVLSKLAVNSLRALTLLIAVLPMAALPVVFGGVSPLFYVRALFSQLAALSVALTAGMLSSTLHREWIEAAVWAELYSFGLAFLIFIIIPFPLGFFLAGYLMFKIVRYCGRRLREKWEDEGDDFKPPIWTRLFSDSEFWRSIFDWDTRKTRSVNPIAWLQEYSWTARLSKWGWCIFVLISEFFLLFASLAGGARGARVHFFLAAILVLGMALAGAHSFRRERLSGAMELLLVTPLSPFKLILGRLWGLWIHFFPAAAVLLFIWRAVAKIGASSDIQTWMLVSSFWFLPVIGLYVSMFPWNVLVAWMVIFLGGAVIPWYLPTLFWLDFAPFERVAFMILLQFVLAAIALYLLHQQLKSRSFILHS